MTIPEEVTSALIVISGIALTVTGTYWIAKMADTYLSYNIDTEAIARRIEEYRRRDKSVILHEMKTDERLRVLERVLDVRPWSEELCAQVKLDHQKQEENIRVVNVEEATDESNKKINRNKEEIISLSTTSGEQNPQGVNLLNKVWKQFGDERNGNVDKRYDVDGDFTETCAICMEDYKEYEDVAIGATCVHMYHKDCLVNWLQTKHDTCPYCRSYSFSVTKFVKISKEQLGDDRFKELVGKENPEFVSMYMTGVAGSLTIQNETDRNIDPEEAAEA